jgi:regulator of telomere elongation helicase 1
VLYREPKVAQEYQLIMDRFYSAVFEEDGGAILMAVCRGRISEGLDFSDKAARAVIVVGIPYPQMTDPKIILKKEYLDQK